MMQVLITGANGHLGRRLIRTLGDGVAIKAVVRRERAREKLLASCGSRPELAVSVLDPRDSDALRRVASDCDCVVHLIGMIRATPGNRLVDSHEHAARALSKALAGSRVKRLVYVSILGASETSPSRVLRAREAVESLLGDCSAALRVIRVPMVLGEGDRASAALGRRAKRPRSFVFRANSLEQPIYAGDVIAAVIAALNDAGDENRSFDLAGPESLTRRDLIMRAAATLNLRPTVHSLPIGLGLLVARTLELIQRRPAVTVDMLRVLDHDDRIDPSPAAGALNLELTPLEETLRRVIN